MKKMTGYDDYKVNKISISVIIPMYNAEKTIEKTLESVEKQSLVSCVKEVIIINDGSIDNSLQLIEHYKEKSKLNLIIHTQKNSGVSVARNKGMSMATSDWFALLDSDDTWFQDKLKHQVEIIIQNNSIDFLGGNWVKKPLKIFNREINTLYKIKLKDLCIKSFPQTSTVLFKREIFDNIGGYDTTQSHGEDLNYFMKICMMYQMYYDPKQVIEFGDGKNGFGDSGLSANLKKMHQGNQKNIRMLYEGSSINKGYYMSIYSYNILKYIRRIIITKIRNKRHLYIWNK